MGEKLLKYAIDDNEIMKVPLVSKTEFEQDTSFDGPFGRSSNTEPRSDCKIDRVASVIQAIAKQDQLEDDSFDESDDDDEDFSESEEESRDPDPIHEVYDSLIPTLTTKEASRILRKGRDLCWILRKNEDGDLRISLKGSDHGIKQIRLYGDKDNKYSRRPDGKKIGLKQLLKSMMDDGTL